MAYSLAMHLVKAMFVSLAMLYGDLSAYPAIAGVEEMLMITPPSLLMPFLL